uniref:Uncharacterized protein n=1 Tax=Glossina palpalis gambiensis TaxID=67801 RepID=A0A1B0BF09_9MUSC
MHFLILQALKVVCLRRRPVNVLSLTVILEPRRAESVMGVLCGRILPVLGFREKITADGLSVSMSTLETKFEDMCSELMNLIKQCFERLARDGVPTTKQFDGFCGTFVEAFAGYCIEEFFVRCNNLSNDAEPGPEFKLNAFNTFYFRCIDVLKIMGTLNKAKSCSVGIHGTPINFRVCSETAHVVPIRKSRVVNNPDDLRTISLFPAIPKIAEHLINNHVFEATRTNTYESQYASDIVLPHCHSALRILNALSTKRCFILGLKSRYITMSNRPTNLRLVYQKPLFKECTKKK